MRYIIVFVILIVCESSLFSETIVKGVLDNGLSYYLIQNNSPKVDFYLIQNSGASNETKDESGYFHLVEHLSFYASKNFPKGTAEFINRHGISNGASTYKDKIVYSLKNVDISRVAFDSCVSILHDWGTSLHFTEKSLDAEQKIITEEGRSDQRVKMDDAVSEYFFKGSPLGIPSTMGELKNVQQATLESITSFYKKWFAPNLQAICIVGNINKEECERMIRQQYADVVANGKAITRYEVPSSSTPLIKKYDTKAPFSTFDFIVRIKDYTCAEQKEFIRREVYMKLFENALKMRMLNFDLKNRNHFKTLTFKPEKLVVNCNLLITNFSCSASNDLKCVEEIGGQIGNLSKQGLLKEELYLLLKNNIDLASNYDAYQITENNFLLGTPIYTKADYEEVCTALSDEFSNKEFIDFCHKYIDTNSSLVLARTGFGSQIESNSDILKSMVNPAKPFVLMNKKVEFKEDTRANNRTKNFEKYAENIFKISLQDGPTIIYKQVKSDSVVIRGFALGGLSSVPKKDILVYKAYPYLIENGSIDEYSAADLQTYRTRNGINCNFYVDRYSNNFRATAPVAQCNTLYDYLTRKLTNSTCEQSSLALYLEKEEFKDKYLSGGQDEEKINRQVYGSDLYQTMFAKSVFDMLTPEIVSAQLRTIYGNGAGWCYVVESPISFEEFKEKSLIYFDRLNGGGKTFNYSEPKEMILKKDIRKEQFVETDNGLGGLEFNKFFSIQLSSKEVIALNLLQYIVRNRCIEEFRDNKKALYGIFSKVENPIYPENNYRLYINFGAESQNIHPFLSFIKNQFKLIAQEGNTLLELTRAKAGFQQKGFKAFQSQLEMNEYKKFADKGYKKFYDFNTERILSEININDIMNIAKKVEKRAVCIETVFLNSTN